MFLTDAYLSVSQKVCDLQIWLIHYVVLWVTVITGV